MQPVLPDTGFVRIKQIVGDKKAGILPIIPISRTAWLDGVRAGKYPQPVKLGPNTTVWRCEDIRALICRAGMK